MTALAVNMLRKYGVDTIISELPFLDAVWSMTDVMSGSLQCPE